MISTIKGMVKAMAVILDLTSMASESNMYIVWLGVLFNCLSISPCVELFVNYTMLCDNVVFHLGKYAADHIVPRK